MPFNRSKGAAAFAGLTGDGKIRHTKVLRKKRSYSIVVTPLRPRPKPVTKKLKAKPVSVITLSSEASTIVSTPRDNVSSDSDDQLPDLHSSSCLEENPEARRLNSTEANATSAFGWFSPICAQHAPESYYSDNYTDVLAQSMNKTVLEETSDKDDEKYQCIEKLSGNSGSLGKDDYQMTPLGQYREDHKHRLDKKIPDWALEENLAFNLFLQQPELMNSLKEHVFPPKQLNFKPFESEPPHSE